MSLYFLQKIRNDKQFTTKVKTILQRYVLLAPHLTCPNYINSLTRQFLETVEKLLGNGLELFGYRSLSNLVDSDQLTV